MKKVSILLVMFICVFSLVSCSSPKEDTLNLGINAVITEIDTERETITVKDADEKGILGEKSIIDCSEIPIIYCNYETQLVKDISFEDLEVDDAIILNIRSSEIEALHSEEEKTVKVEQIQLATQRIE